MNRLQRRNPADRADEVRPEDVNPDEAERLRRAMEAAEIDRSTQQFENLGEGATEGNFTDLFPDDQNGQSQDAGVLGQGDVLPEIGTNTDTQINPQVENKIDQTRNEQVRILTDEERQSFLQQDILNVLLRTKAGRILLGDIKQQEARARAEMERLDQEPTKQQLKMREVKRDLTNIKRAAFPQAEQIKYIKENADFDKLRA